MAKVTLKNVNKKYDKNVVAVQDFNLEIADKEFIVLVGPSGCGKSTTLRMIAGLEDITSGEIYIGNTLVNHIEPKDRDIAMVFQNYALYPHKTVFENMAFALKIRKESKDVIKQKVYDAADILGIVDLLDRKPKALSGGQRQRVAIGRAIVRNPKVFLMDEPLSNLDAKLRNQMRAELIKLSQKIDTTFIYVTHDQTEAMTLGDRIVIMNQAIVQQIGTPEEVFGTPANIFVAGFIGSPQMNFFNAKLDNINGRYEVKIGGNRIAVTEEQNKNFAKLEKQAGEIILGIRPEHIVLGQNVPGIPASIDVVEMMGSELYLHVDTMGKDVVVRMPATSENALFSSRNAKGMEVGLTIPASNMHLFDKESGKNLLFGGI